MKTDNPAPSRKQVRRPLREALRFGAELDAQSAAHPSTVSRKPDHCGRLVFTGRLGGLRQYLRGLPGACPYSTAMRYRHLVRRLLRVLDLPGGLPPAWVFSEAPVATLASDPALAAAAERARADLEAILADAPGHRALARKLDGLLGDA